MKGQLRFGVVGAGRVAQSYVQAFEDHHGARIVAVADIRTDAASALAEALGCEWYNSYEAMAERSTQDAVIICTPPATHPEVCLHFLKRKVHVLCEKPLSIDAESARKMANAAAEAGVMLTMASKFRYVDDVVRAKSMVLSGALGEIALVENAFTSRIDMSSRWNSNPTISGGGVLIDHGTHSVDLMRYFLGPIAEVHCAEGGRSQAIEVEDSVLVLVRNARGVMGIIDLSWSIEKRRDSYVDIYGTHGAISVGWRESKYREWSRRDWVVFGNGYNKIQAFRDQINNFSKAIRGQEALLITTEDALASVEVIEAAYTALARQSWTPVGQQTASRETPDGHVFIQAEEKQ